MLTFFTTAKPFLGHNNVIQRNALRSWKLLHPQAEVILFGDDEGAAEVCAELGLRHEPHVERHESGMKHLHFMFRRAREIASHDFLCYANCDIVLAEDFRGSFAHARSWREKFFLVGRRWDTDVTEPIDFENADWSKALREFALKEGSRQSSHFVDFFVFPKNFYTQVPPMVVGRSYWDHWLVWKAIDSGMPVLDCTAAVVTVHQNHNYGYHPQGKTGTNRDAVAMRNLELAGGHSHQRCIDDAPYRMAKDGSIGSNWRQHLRVPRESMHFMSPAGNFLTYRIFQPVWHGILNVTRPVRNSLGLRSKAAVRSHGKS